MVELTKSLDLAEAKASKIISKHLNTNHNELIIDHKDLLNTIPDLSKIYDEPFADSSQIPTMLVSQIARKKVKVILGGDGGDEIFGGYNRYLLANKYWKYLKYFPKPFNLIFRAQVRTLINLCLSKLR